MHSIAGVCHSSNCSSQVGLNFWLSVCQFCSVIRKYVSVDRFNIPKDSIAMANLWGFMKDPDHWEDLDMFRPERLLEKTELGLKIIKKEKFVPYGIGRSVCMGESLAQDNLFIFVATLIKKLED